MDIKCKIYNLLQMKADEKRPEIFQVKFPPATSVAERRSWIKPIGLIVVVIGLVTLFPLITLREDPVADLRPSKHLEQPLKKFMRTGTLCSDQCSVQIVESIPDNLTFVEGSPQFQTTYAGWMQLLSVAKETIHIASYYWSLRAGNGSVPVPFDDEGEIIFNELMRAGTERNISIQIAQNEPSSSEPDYDTQELEASGAAEVRTLDFEQLVGAGILHTKFWVVDNQHFYIGSANMDWRSLTQVKELGIVAVNCGCLAEDLDKIFQIYWMLGEPGAVIPPTFPPELETEYNSTDPAEVTLSGTDSLVYFGSSPPQMCTEERTGDIDAILDVMDKAKKFVYISVMEYYPCTIYDYPYIYWPSIDDKLRQIALEKKIQVRLMGANWNHTYPDMAYYLASLGALNNTNAPLKVEVKMFVVPSFNAEQDAIPYARVNHAKFMVTDNAAYIGTSNWSADYFINTGGASIIVNQTSSGSSEPIREDLLAVFNRDWESQYAKPITDFIHYT